MTKKTWVTLGSSHRSFVMRNTVVMLKGGSKRVVRLQLDAANPNTDVLRSYKRRFLSSLLGAAACLTSCAARDGGGGDKHKGSTFRIYGSGILPSLLDWDEKDGASSMRTNRPRGRETRLVLEELISKPVGGTAVADSTHKIVIKVALMGGVAKGKPQQNVIQRVSLLAIMADRESHSVPIAVEAETVLVTAGLRHHSGNVEAVSSHFERKRSGTRTPGLRGGDVYLACYRTQQEISQIRTGQDNPNTRGNFGGLYIEKPRLQFASLAGRESRHFEQYCDVVQLGHELERTL
ncbi:hypothetical protein V8E52_008696 [Russula decolorans]